MSSNLILDQFLVNTSILEFQMSLFLLASSFMGSSIFMRNRKDNQIQAQPFLVRVTAWTDTHCTRADVSGSHPVCVHDCTDNVFQQCVAPCSAASSDCYIPSLERNLCKVSLTLKIPISPKFYKSNFQHSSPEMC